MVVPTSSHNPPPLICWPYHRYLRGLWHAWLPPLVLWVPEGYPPCGALWGPQETGWSPYKEELIADIDAWRPEASMPGWPGWLAWLAGWLGWLAWLAGRLLARLAAWLAGAAAVWVVG